MQPNPQHLHALIYPPTAQYVSQCALITVFCDGLVPARQFLHTCDVNF